MDVCLYLFTFDPTHCQVPSLTIIFSFPSPSSYAFAGGKRVRKMKERFAVTELRAQQNKVSFRTDVGEYGDSAMGFDAVSMDE